VTLALFINVLIIIIIIINGSTWARDLEKNTGQQQKSQKYYISPILGKPPLDRFDPKVARWVTSTT